MYVNRWDDDDHVNQLTLPDRQRGQLLVILFLISFLFCVRSQPPTDSCQGDTPVVSPGVVELIRGPKKEYNSL